MADYFETAQDLSREWWDFIDNKTTIKPVIGEYKCYANEKIISVNSHAVGMAEVQQYGFKIDFVRNFFLIICMIFRFYA